VEVPAAAGLLHDPLRGASDGQKCKAFVIFNQFLIILIIFNHFN
jgi:hypothetical protein